MKMSNEEEKRFGLGPGGNCVCTDCGHKISHKRGIPCSQEKCPKCGGKMIRAK
jgi:electron transport complex protein RnfB